MLKVHDHIVDAQWARISNHKTNVRVPADAVVIETVLQLYFSVVRSAVNQLRVVDTVTHVRDKYNKKGSLSKKQNHACFLAIHRTFIYQYYHMKPWHHTSNISEWLIMGTRSRQKGIAYTSRHTSARIMAQIPPRWWYVYTREKKSSRFSRWVHLTNERI